MNEFLGARSRCRRALIASEPQGRSGTIVPEFPRHRPAKVLRERGDNFRPAAGSRRCDALPVVVNGALNVVVHAEKLDPDRARVRAVAERVLGRIGHKLGHDEADLPAALAVQLHKILEQREADVAMSKQRPRNGPAQLAQVDGEIDVIPANRPLQRLVQLCVFEQPIDGGADGALRLGIGCLAAASESAEIAKPYSLRTR